MEELTDDSKMPFGMHKNKRLEDVPASYLLWLENNGTSVPKNLLNYIADNKKVLDEQARDKGNNINRTIRGW